MAKTTNPARGRPVDPEKVKNAQTALIVAGGNVNRAAQASGTDARTIRSYISKGLIDPTVVVDGAENLATLEQLTAERHENLAVRMVDTAERAVEQTFATIHEASPLQAAQVAKNMVETSKLLQGKATKVVDVNVNTHIETLRRNGLVIELNAEEVIEAEVV